MVFAARGKFDRFFRFCTDVQVQLGQEPLSPIPASKKTKRSLNKTSRGNMAEEEDVPVYELDVVRGLVFMQHHAVPTHFDKQSHFRRKVELSIRGTMLLIHDVKEERQALHVIDLVKSHGGPLLLNPKMFYLDSAAWNEKTSHVVHKAHHIYFLASSETGRDLWLSTLEERGMRFDQQLPCCEHHHRLVRTVLSKTQACDCNLCGAKMSAHHATFRCGACDYDLCGNCHR
jgi:hypothetical protein